MDRNKWDQPQMNYEPDADGVLAADPVGLAALPPEERSRIEESAARTAERLARRAAGAGLD